MITDELIREVLRRISSHLKFKQELISWEVQDEGQFLLISIALNDFHGCLTQTEKLRETGLILNQVIPGRHGEYSWMVVFTQDGKVVESYFGGDLDCPDSGL